MPRRSSLPTTRRALCVLVLSALVLSATFTPTGASDVASGHQEHDAKIPSPAAPFLDELSQPKPWWHVNTWARTVRLGFRAFSHSLRDLFFPDFRLQSTALKVSGNSIDKQQPGESQEDYVTRLAMRDSMIDLADEWGLPELYARHPTTFRYTAAIILGLFLMVFFFAFQGLVNALVKGCMRVLLRLTGHELFVDETSDSEIALLERLQEEAEKRRQQAQAEAGKAKKSDGDDDNAAPATAPATAARTAPAPAAAAAAAAAEAAGSAAAATGKAASSSTGGGGGVRRRREA